MGGIDKGLAPWNGAPFVSHVHASIEPQVERVLISCNRNLDQYRRYADTVFSDERSDYQGPLAGLEAAQAHLMTPLLLVVPCDMPQLPSNLAARLVAGLEADPAADLSYARSGGRDHYLCAVIRRNSLPSLVDFLESGGRAVHRWYATLRSITVEFEDTNAFGNHNSV